MEKRGGGGRSVKKFFFVSVGLGRGGGAPHNTRKFLTVPPPPPPPPRHSEPRGLDCRRLRVRIRRYRLFEEVFDQILESRIIPRRKTALKDRPKRGPVLQEQSKIAFRAANIPGENHGL